MQGMRLQAPYDTQRSDIREFIQLPGAAGGKKQILFALDPSVEGVAIQLSISTPRAREEHNEARALRCAFADSSLLFVLGAPPTGTAAAGICPSACPSESHGTPRFSACSF